MGDSYARLGSRFRQQEGESYAHIVRDYPLSEYADSAKKKLRELEIPVPEADPKAVARMQWEKDNRLKPGMVSKTTGFLRRGPDVSTAARSGAPAMTTMRPTIPLSVPPTGPPGFTGDVTATTVNDSTALDTKPDARANPPGSTQAATSDSQTQTQSAATDQQKSQKKKKKDKKPKPADTTHPAAAPSSSSSSSPAPPKL
jgi:outer membrane protein assembly factor BamD